MESHPFVTIRCPACGSTEVDAQVAGRFTCRHCHSNFLYTGGRTVMREEATASRSGAVLVGVVAAVLLVFGAAVFVLFFAAGDDDVAPMPTPVRPAAVSTPEVAPPPPSRAVPERAPVPVPAPIPDVAPAPPPVPAEPAPVVLADYQRLRGCACPARAAGTAVELYVLPKGRTTSITGAGMEVQHHLDFVLAATGSEPWRLPVDADTAPANGYARNFVSVGVGCHADVVVIAAGRTASAWSMAGRRLLWSQTLPAAFGTFEQRADTDMVLDCAPLRLAKDSVTLRAGGRPVRLSLADGTLR